MEKAIIIYISLCFTGMSLFGQEIVRQQFSAEGGSASIGSLSIAYTVGESFTGLGTSGRITVVQGFQQGFTPMATSLGEIPYKLSLAVFPNPSVAEVHLYLTSDRSLGLDISLLTLDGKEVRKYSFPQRRSLHQVQLNVSQLAPGNYQLLLYDHQRQFIQAYKLQKR
ncbi:MAG: hypothetical protein AAF694_31405 [Bacteroidota bacterium]